MKIIRNQRHQRSIFPKTNQKPENEAIQQIAVLILSAKYKLLDEIALICKNI